MTDHRSLITDMPEEPKKLILVVDDEPRMIQFIRMNLELEGYRVTQAANGLKALDRVRDELPDLVILDVMMPDLDGFETLRMLREVSSVPVIMLTVKADEDDKVKGLELGADDYVTKPFSLRELLARVRALLRRAQPARALLDELRINEVAIDFRSYEARKGGVRLEMTRREFQLLRVLASRPGEVITRAELLDQVWGLERYPTTRTVDNHIAGLRAKLERDPAQPEHLLTMRGVGYKWAP